MTQQPGCKARQHSDQMSCSQCGLQWDMNDPDPPPCRKDKPVKKLNKLLALLSLKGKPDERLT